MRMYKGFDTIRTDVSSTRVQIMKIKIRGKYVQFLRFFEYSYSRNAIIPERELAPMWMIENASSLGGNEGIYLIDSKMVVITRGMYAIIISPIGIP